MMTVEQAKQAALDYFKKKGINGLASAKEGEGYYIFFGGKKGEKVVGRAGLKIEKETGAQSAFILPNKENFALLNSAEEIEL